MGRIYWVIFIIGFIIIAIYFNKGQEDFNLLQTGVESNNCYDKSLDDCLNFANCGIATVNGRRFCDFGDEEGPFYNMNTNFNSWEYRNDYDQHIFNGEGAPHEYKPWSSFYPIYDVFYPSPTSLAALF